VKQIRSEREREEEEEEKEREGRGGGTYEEGYEKYLTLIV
jgi:hypothetical protein